MGARLWRRRLLRVFGFGCLLYFGPMLEVEVLGLGFLDRFIAGAEMLYVAWYSAIIVDYLSACAWNETPKR